MMGGEYYQCHLKLSMTTKNYMKNNETEFSKKEGSHLFEAEMEGQTDYIKYAPDEHGILSKYGHIFTMNRINVIQ
jgi:hypothetical protein